MGKSRTEEKRISEMEALLQLLTDSEGAPPEATDPGNETYILYRSALEEDLKTPLDPEGGGPLSLARLAGAPSKALEFCRRRNLLQIFLDDQTPLEGLITLKDLGKRLIGPVFPDRIRTLGKALYFLGVASARTLHGTEIGSLTPEEFRHGLRALGKLDEIDPQLARLCADAERMDKRSSRKH